ncbi:hypothetical protein BDP81DRAFT_439551 [Colletotrichum phormii]|uniref:Uncharacterized protein n=1 Tax=Colletotrichum phormii TaxID=359342 RepID=A0AAJ0E9B7_9PEZI|nr:uncharacterized protein BDP81DRAFT_439551 [Colletotrichum phormii]KAK1623431.1 hypothetical protein BDP81DRAFT_439551 [Colletotrichum phormii]
MYNLLGQRNGTFNKHSLSCPSRVNFFITSGINFAVVVVCLCSFRRHAQRNDSWLAASHCFTLAASIISVCPLYRILFKSHAGQCKCMNDAQPPVVAE